MDLPQRENIITLHAILLMTFSTYSLLKLSVQARIINTFFAIFGLHQYDKIAASAEERIIILK